MIRRFLLGSLSAADQVTFDERLFADDGLEKRVRLAECELADGYAFDLLTPADRELFEQRFLVSAARQQKLIVSTALRDRFASAVTNAAPSAMTLAERLQRWLGLGQPSWKLALRIIILLLLIGTMWSVLRGPRLGKRFLAERRPAPVATPAPNQQEANHPIKPSPPQLKEGIPAPPDQLVATPVTVMLVPQHGYDPAHIATVSLPGGEPSGLHVQLTFKGNGEIYRAELLTITGQSVFSQGALKPSAGGDSVGFDVPRQFLNPGDYQVKLIRVTDGIEAGVATYYFRVQ